ncbi:hypothetical protein ABGF49_04940 [Helcococcus ovis]|uniref:Uncharacterized protein n=2 Tax=Helcococcus ovis TaxID=72026 RepID=A0A4R9C1K7_9FIRM|nr:hypothetical protein [Helcococcus ovis]TFF64303.1 hypothetical protein EQF92_06270 [Helcococcus ovis]TFF66538.1 hypothetical protein EQF91_03545 [Helcococcus ovis]TFF68882.1 hypothetical protein EQF93_00225 [Helcococcus ovis]WNZ00687.1 hypothetical protein EQF90_005345 [Helcococcus ovis]
MKVGELLLTNKDKYTKAFLIHNDKETNNAVFMQIKDENIDKDLIDKDAKDYFLLDNLAIDEIFGNSDKLGITDDDKVFIIGI